MRIPDSWAISEFLAMALLTGCFSAMAENGKVLQSVAPPRIIVGQPVQPTDEGKWVEAEGVITFVGRRGKEIDLELSSQAGHMRR